MVVKTVVAEVRELVEDLVLWISPKLGHFVVDFLHVGFAAGCSDVLSPVSTDLGESLFTHLFWKYHERTESQARTDPGAADSVVAGGGKYQGPDLNFREKSISKTMEEESHHFLMKKVKQQVSKRFHKGKEEAKQC